MNRIKNLQDLFKRYRRPGDLVFAVSFFVLSLFLLVNLPAQTAWVERTSLFAQPAFWPAVAIGVMIVFSALHLLGAVVSERIPGRLAEVLYWARSLEFAIWFMAYVAIVPLLGYLPSTALFCASLAYRMGYRSLRWMGISVLFAVAVALLFKSFLQVKLPVGLLYEWLPVGIRSFVMTYF
ncbi:tripartite tricarboxylate transporter TctB family protein [Roseibium salinum]|uniref:Tripartite tricarboxylate transporter TctB family protein n=1 Tax=Roseibium salinum TaxID=1604349 RepID=A0ABT3QVZ0_9HYPH|nr:tripartite tricarboxylate transporter TctB family protein [Roseibium sp. DSM 29163]MCX2721093.1 tripartite tricarboxylate transporter TctB family protein [Roseibium sp. DSM 29163]MDN3722555.1 tripartite tricarboxylate transporter TctB family protein [Roseibium salinum]